MAEEFTSSLEIAFHQNCYLIPLLSQSLEKEISRRSLSFINKCVRT